MIEKQKLGFLYYQFKEFMDIEFIKHLFTSRIGWDNKKIKKQLSLLLKVDEERILNVKQVHGTDILVVDSFNNTSSKYDEMEYDGLITHLHNILLMTYHADCVPIYFVDVKKKVIGIAHGGWRGTFNNISGKMIDKIKEVYNSKEMDILVAIGPSIGPCCYEISKDLSQLFNDKYKDFEDIIINKDDKVFLDLWKLNSFQLQERGIPKENIILSNICTSCNIDKFFSYRREKGIASRMIAGICLK